MTQVRHATCGQMAERDEYGFTEEPHKSNACRGSAHHPTGHWPKSTKAAMRGKKGTF